MKKLLFYIAILNVLDAGFTFFGLHYSIIEEANPLMNKLFAASPLLFLMIKIGLSVILLVIGNALNNRKCSVSLVWVSVFAAFGYTITCFLHGFWIATII